MCVPEKTDAMLMVPLDDGRQRARVLQGQAADVGQPLLQVGLLDAVAVGEDRRLLLAQIHVQAGIPTQQNSYSSAVLDQ